MSRNRDRKACGILTKMLETLGTYELKKNALTVFSTSVISTQFFNIYNSSNQAFKRHANNRIYNTDYLFISSVIEEHKYNKI